MLPAGRYPASSFVVPGLSSRWACDNLGKLLSGCSIKRMPPQVSAAQCNCMVYYAAMAKKKNLPEYILRRTSRRRSVAIMVLPDGTLEVRAPKRVSIGFIETFLHERLEWIKQKQKERETRPQLPKRTWLDGDVFYINGVPHTLVVKESSRISVEVADGELILFQTDPTNATRARHNLMQWYKDQALHDFKPRLARLANAMEEKVPNLEITNAKQRWGSCQAKKRMVRLSVRLLMAPKDVQDYVIVHELAHLKHMDHSRDFWNRVATFCRHYKAMEEKLSHNAQLWRFD